MLNLKRPECNDENQHNKIYFQKNIENHFNNWLILTKVLTNIDIEN